MCSYLVTLISRKICRCLIDVPSFVVDWWNSWWTNTVRHCRQAWLVPVLAWFPGEDCGFVLNWTILLLQQHRQWCVQLADPEPTSAVWRGRTETAPSWCGSCRRWPSLMARSALLVCRHCLLTSPDARNTLLPAAAATSVHHITMPQPHKWDVIHCHQSARPSVQLSYAHL